MALVLEVRRASSRRESADTPRIQEIQVATHQRNRNKQILVVDLIIFLRLSLH